MGDSPSLQWRMTTTTNITTTLHILFRILLFFNSVLAHLVGVQGTLVAGNFGVFDTNGSFTFFATESTTLLLVLKDEWSTRILEPIMA
ncbi:hypothetical protein QBC45DRAFT_407649 [Copromyces sp. CBS 386.78]|nr:hypothetical protein QBC45DRAFT_407649 [Copromyces sp. CBS 386.78]